MIDITTKRPPSTPLTPSVEELLYRLRSRLLATINIARTRSVSMRGNAISKNQIHSATSAPIGLKFCTRLEGDNRHKLTGENFETLPLKNLAPL